MCSLRGLKIVFPFWRQKKTNHTCAVCYFSIWLSFKFLAFTLERASTKSICQIVYFIFIFRWRNVFLIVSCWFKWLCVFAPCLCCARNLFSVRFLILRLHSPHTIVHTEVCARTRNFRLRYVSSVSKPKLYWEIDWTKASASSANATVATMELTMNME